MLPISASEYDLTPIAPPKRAEVPEMLTMDLESDSPIPMMPLNQLPELRQDSQSLASHSDAGPTSSSTLVHQGAQAGAAAADVVVSPSQQRRRRNAFRGDPRKKSGEGPASEEHSEGGTAWRIATSDGPIWLEGDSILCACPDCGAPMSVRLWLMLAQCWQCATQIELTEEQQRAVESLMERRERAKKQRSQEDHESQDRVENQRRPEPVAVAAPAATDTRPTPASQRRPAPATNGATPNRTPSGSLHRTTFQRRGQSRKLTPAWLISLVLHFILVLLLALLAISDYVEMDSITLSSFVGTTDEEGGIEIDAAEDSPMQFELPLPPDADLEDEDEREELEEAASDARELREDENPSAELPDLNSVRDHLSSSPSERSHFVARDPRMRVEMVQREGGTTVTEAAVARGLNWLARHQNQDGSWSLEDYERSNKRSNEGDAAATSLALLPFLGAGQTHEYGRYKENVAAGLMWLLTHQEDDGDLRAGMTSQMGMYAHGQATIVLVEALALSGDERFRGPAQRAINFIVDAQHELGGWRYRPGQEGDTSVLGWQLMALQSARSPGVGLEVPDTTLKLASYYLDLCSETEGALYSYQPRTKDTPTETMTAEALLCRMYLGWSHDDPRFEAGLNWLADRAMPSKRDKNIYYWYYATQTFHNYGGPKWDEWNRKMQHVLVDLQETRGRHAGSWSPSGFEYGSIGDRIYVTALAVCTLEVYYRHLPIYRRVDLSDEE